jgi:hypothetical protein
LTTELGQLLVCLPAIDVWVWIGIQNCLKELVIWIDVDEPFRVNPGICNSLVASICWTWFGTSRRWRLLPELLW